MKLPNLPARVTLGSRLDKGTMFELILGGEPVHILVTGRTGSGKSRLLIQLVKALIDNGIAVAVLEPGHLCDDVVANYARKVVETGNTDVLKRIHYLRAGPGMCFRYDAFRFHCFQKVHPELMESMYRAWRHCRAQNVAEILQSKQGTESFEGMPRLQRILNDILICVGTIFDGGRLSLADAKILLDLTHPMHEEIFGKLSGELPREVVSDFEVLHSFKRVEDLRRETESTLNRLRAFLGPLTSQILSATGREPCVDLFQIIQRGECLLVPLQEDQFFSHDQKLSLGALIFHDLIETLIVTPRELMKPLVIVVDEAGELITILGERLNRAAGMIRKHKGTLVIAGQNLGTFKKE